MHKKLYKAKKNLVIGLIAGSVFMVSSAIEVNADETMSETTTSIVEKYQQDPIDFNIKLYENNSENQDAYKYAENIEPNPTLVTWGSSKYGFDTQTQQKSINFQDIPINRGQMTYAIPSDSLQYRFNYNGNNKNYQSISKLSNVLADQSDNFIKTQIFTYYPEAGGKDYNNFINTHTYSASYTNNDKNIDAKPSKNSSEIDTKELVRVRSGSIDNGLVEYTRPKVTFDRNGYTSFLQSTVAGHGASSYAFDYTSNLQGYTFQNGQQLPLTYFLKSVDNTAKYLRGIAYKYLRAVSYGEDKKYGLPYSGDVFVNGPTSYYLRNDGIYAFMPNGSGIASWNWPLAIRLPLTLIKKEYLGMFDNFAQKQEDLETLENDINSAIKEQIENGLIDKGTGKLIKSQVMADGIKLLEKDTLNLGKNGFTGIINYTFNQDSVVKIISSYFTDTIKGALDLQNDAGLLEEVEAKDIIIIKNSTDTVANTVTQGYDAYKIAKLDNNTPKLPQNAQTLDARFNNLKKTRNYHLDNYKREAKNAKNVASTILFKEAPKKSGLRQSVKTAIVAVSSAAIISIFALVKWNLFNLGKLAGKFGIKIIDKWKW